MHVEAYLNSGEGSSVEFFGGFEFVTCNVIVTPAAWDTDARGDEVSCR